MYVYMYSVALTNISVICTCHDESTNLITSTSNLQQNVLESVLHNVCSICNNVLYSVMSESILHSVCSICNYVLYSAMCCIVLCLLYSAMCVV
jgi:hypothetical protein